MRVLRCVAGALLCCTVAALLPATAQAQKTQGSSLAAPANYPYHCDYRWSSGPFGPGGYQEFVPVQIGASTCSIWQGGVPSQAQLSHLVPGTGTVTKARVRSGPNPAAISIATVRLYEGRSQTVPGGIEQTCCAGVSETPPVTPTPNAVTEIPVNFRVEAQPYDPNTGRAGFHDVVVVNAVGTTGTLPIHDRGGPKPFGLTLAPDSIYWYFPKFNPSQNNQNQWFAPGFEVLMNYDWTPDAPKACAAAATQACPPATPPPSQGAKPAPGGGPTPATRRSAAVRSSSLTLRRGKVGVRVACTATTACKGRVRLRTAAKKPRLLGSRSLSVKPGRTATVTVGVARKLRRLVKPKGTKVTVEVDLGAAGKVTRRVTLRRG